MTTKVTLHIGQKNNIRRSHPASNGLRFSCAGEGCVTKYKCPRWNHIYREKHRNN
jgi:hypothetical protein